MHYGSQQIIAVSYERLLELLDEYKQDLGLRDWTIGIGIRRAFEIESRHGHVNLAETKKQAYIRLLHPDDANPLDLVPYDMEVTLVHELLHCAFAPFTYEEEGSHTYIIQEQAIERASRSFVDLKRRVRDLEAGLPPSARQVVEIRQRKAA